MFLLQGRFYTRKLHKGTDIRTEGAYLIYHYTFSLKKVSEKKIILTISKFLHCKIFFEMKNSIEQHTTVCPICLQKHTTNSNSSVSS